MNPIKQDVKNGVLREYKWGDMLFNYGAFPQTWEDPKEISEETGCPGDNDPIDVIELGTRQRPTGSITRVKVGWAPHRGHLADVRGWGALDIQYSSCVLLDRAVSFGGGAGPHKFEAVPPQTATLGPDSTASRPNSAKLGPSVDRQIARNVVSWATRGDGTKHALLVIAVRRWRRWPRG